MWFRILPLSFIFFLACQPAIQKENSPEKIDSSIQQLNNESIIRPIEFQNHEYNISMYNEKYRLLVNMDSKGVEGYTAHLVLLKKNDTIVQHFVNLDTIHNRYYEFQVTSDPLERIDFLNEFELQDITCAFVRTNSLYFNAWLKSKSDTTSFPVILKWKYMNPRKGGFYVNVL